MSIGRVVNTGRVLFNILGHRNGLAKMLNKNQTRYWHQSIIKFSNTDMPKKDLKKKIETLGDKFSEARELLSDARESMGTVYFSEDMEEAAEAVAETLKEYQELQGSVSDKQREELVSTLGLRMEELKAQQAAIEETLKD